MTLRRRDFITLLSSAAAAWPLAARAQQRAMPVIGFLGASSLQSMAGMALLNFKRGLTETGYVEGRDIGIEYRFGDDHYDRLPALAAELVQRRVDVIAAPGVPGALAAKAATSVIPVVFMIPDDPVELGLVASINRPGGNITGFAYLNEEVAPKRLGLLHEFIPAAKSIGFLVNPASPGPAAAQVKEMQAAANTLGLRVVLANAASALDLEEAFAIFVRERVEAIQMGIDGFFGNHIDQIVALATRSKIPMIYPWREFTAAGGLMNYGASIPEAFQQLGVFTGRILKGAKPADLPIQRPTKLQLVLNVQAAKAIGVEFPASLLAIADEVIE
jgi:putative ABC transport system substrate-binding protein